jgi:hypothetical protein
MRRPAQRDSVHHRDEGDRADLNYPRITPTGPPIAPARASAEMDCGGWQDDVPTCSKRCADGQVRGGALNSVSAASARDGSVDFC